MSGPDKPLNELSVCDAVSFIADGVITSEALVTACLERIEAREPAVKAWLSLDAGLAIRQAKVCDAGPKGGAFSGVPIAVKDVIDTAEYPTMMGSPIYAGYRPKADASCVARARREGAVILGKSVTCEFAGMHPGVTTNPHDASRTPGGSSSGSAAAVADFMVPMAYGTQTGGSVIRPASFCGIVGFKPTYGAINRAGLKFAAESLDTIGFMTRSVDDVAAMFRGHVGLVNDAPSLSPQPRVGFCRTYLWDDKVSDETRAALAHVSEVLREGGASAEDFELPRGFEVVSEMRNVIDNVERSDGMAWEWVNFEDQISNVLGERIVLGEKTTLEAYSEAKRFLDGARPKFDQAMSGFDFLLAPAVSGEAPEGLDYTGDPSFQSLWTALHVPAITLPAGQGPNGMPVGIQLIAPRWRDQGLLVAAAWVEERLASAK